MRTVQKAVVAGAITAVGLVCVNQIGHTSTPYAGELPNGHITPGAVDSAATLSIVCGQSTQARRAVSQATKNKVYANYGVMSHTATSHEVDHLIPLELGGSNDIKNLWPEAAVPTPGFHQKDVLENRMHSLVCTGKMPLILAQKQIATDWVAAYNKYVLKK